MTDDEVVRLQMDARKALDVAREVASKLPKGREAALVLTKLDEARHWLNDVPGTDPAGKKF